MGSVLLYLQRQVTFCPTVKLNKSCSLNELHIHRQTQLRFGKGFLITRQVITILVHANADVRFGSLWVDVTDIP